MVQEGIGDRQGTEVGIPGEPVANGGWNLFHTWWIGGDLLNPLGCYCS